MGLEDLRDELESEVKAILSPAFKINIVETKYVPAVDDPQITYPNLKTMSQACKLLTSCVLHIDIRSSVDLSDSHRQPTLAKLYSAFARGMARCAEYYNGKVRDIIGDRVTVFFDQENCFWNAVNTAILMNSFAQYVLNRWFTGSTVKCGIGIDYGSMLVAKVGIIKHGGENTSHKDLIWLGRPANIASRLADIANKSESVTRDVVTEFLWIPFMNSSLTPQVEIKEFLQKLRTTSSQNLIHPSPLFSSFWLSKAFDYRDIPPILMTDSVFRGFRTEASSDKSIKNNMWKRVGGISIPNVKVDIYGGDIVFETFRSR